MGSPFQILNAMKVFLCFSPTHTPFKGRIFTYKVAFRPHIAPNGAPAFGIVAVGWLMFMLDEEMLCAHVL